MHTRRQSFRARASLCVVVLPLLGQAARSNAGEAARPALLARTVTASVTLDRSVCDRPITGRLFLFTSTLPAGEPRMGPNWFNPQPFFACNVTEFAPGQQRVLDQTSDGFPRPLSQLPTGKYRVQALLDHDFYNPYPGRGAGNFYSDVMEIDVRDAVSLELSLVLNRVVPTQVAGKPHGEEIAVPSRLLSEFHRRDVVEPATVVLPASYHAMPERRYGVVYEIPGFGGTHRSGRAPAPAAEGEVEFIRVKLSGACKWGHHVYADSATNGPRGQALVHELIPYIDAKYRTAAEARARFVTGHSSGGWSSLWLQVNYPETFGGVWSTAPDPVDFRDYQQVDLYADPPLSLYIDEAGDRRPIARRGNEPALWYDSFGKMDDVLGRGGQLRSFEAVFSPLDEQGLPQRLWDRQTGRIDPAVAQAWQRYDIRLVIERDWARLAPLLAGKLHIFTGELDTFFLEGAVRRLAASLHALDSDAQIEIVPGKDHGSLLTPELFARIRREMSAAFLAGQRAL